MQRKKATKEDFFSMAPKERKRRFTLLKSGTFELMELRHKEEAERHARELMKVEHKMNRTSKRILKATSDIDNALAQGQQLMAKMDETSVLGQR